MVNEYYDLLKSLLYVMTKNWQNDTIFGHIAQASVINFS